MTRFLIILPLMISTAAASAEETGEAAASCVVIHEDSEAEGENTTTTCFENISLERSSFESGVCRWKTDAQAVTDVQTKTHFVAHCPTSYSGYCDRLVLGPGVVAPVKIFLYDRSDGVLERARKQCLGGGGNWHTNGENSQ